MTGLAYAVLEAVNGGEDAVFMRRSLNEAGRWNRKIVVLVGSGKRIRMIAPPGHATVQAELGRNRGRIGPGQVDLG